MVKIKFITYLHEQKQVLIKEPQQEMKLYKHTQRHECWSHTGGLGIGKRRGSHSLPHTSDQVPWRWVYGFKFTIVTLSMYLLLFIYIAFQKYFKHWHTIKSIILLGYIIIIIQVTLLQRDYILKILSLSKRVLKLITERMCNIHWYNTFFSVISSKNLFESDKILNI